MLICSQVISVVGIGKRRMPSKTKADSVQTQTLSIEPKFFSLRMREGIHSAHFVLYGILKRVLDLILASSMLIVLTPLFIIVAIAIKIDSPGPAFFRQERVGKDGRIFLIMKFRSMVADNDVRDLSREDEYTKVGKIIRRTSIDELPQLINVLIGQMSFIGPRPWVLEYWTNMNEEERERGKVRPGITGLAAAKGRNGLTIFEKISYDLEYVQNFGLWQDIKVTILTIKTVVGGKEVNVGKNGIHEEIGALKAR